MAEVHTSHFKIFDYWKNKIVLENGKIVDSSTTDHEFPGEWIIEDWSEPCCFACGTKVLSDKTYKTLLGKSEFDNLDDFKILWEDKRTKHKLNRCHIVPGALGGLDKPSNLFLMCEECHSLSPDSTRQDSFMRWVYDRKRRFFDGSLRLEVVMNEVEKDLKRRGLPPISTLIQNTSGNFTKSLEEYMKENVGLHCTHLADSSLITAISNWLVSCSLDSILSE